VSTVGNQRWRERRALYRRPHEQIRTEQYDVAPISTPMAKLFVTTHHYSGTFPADRFRFGLFRNGSLVGVCVFSHPASNRVLTNVFPGRPTDSVELGRLVLLDEVPGNGESWFVAHCLRALKRAGLKGVVSFSDPVPRTTIEGRPVMPGHVGTVYQALNAAWLGRSGAASLRVLPDGTTFSPRAMSKIRTRSRGWQYAQAQLVKFGAEPMKEGEQGREWLRRWLPRLSRPLRHPGNHRYAWSLAGPKLASLGPYPKKAVLS
jgi:hypothetical protein